MKSIHLSSFRKKLIRAQRFNALAWWLNAAIIWTLVLGGWQSSQNNFRGERVLGGPLCLAANGKTLGPIQVQGAPVTGILRVEVYIPGYAGSDTLAFQFNGDTAAANYRYEWLTAAPGGTTFAAGAVAASTDRVKLGQADTNQGRIITAFITDLASKPEKIVRIATVTGTGAAATQAQWDLGNGAWISAANTNINQILVMTTNVNMLKGTCAVVYGI